MQRLSATFGSCGNRPRLCDMPAAHRTASNKGDQTNVQVPDLANEIATCVAAVKSPYGESLPIFPCFYHAPTEDRLECIIERLTDRADNAFLQGKATQAQYDAWTKALSIWSDSITLAR